MSAGPRDVAAHDIPNARIERSTQISLRPERLLVDYEVVLAELTLAQDLRQLDGEAFVGDRVALFERYARVVGPLNARGFLIRIDEAEVELQSVGSTIDVEDHPRFRFRFEAAIPARGRLSVADTNYASSEGSTRLALELDPRVLATGDLPPARVESIPLRPSWQATDGDDRRSRRLVLTYSSRSTPALAPTYAQPSPPPVETPRRRSSGLTRLLDHSTSATAIGWLVTAFVLGMVHAIQPGHGKTMVAAASLDGRVGAGRGVGLGLITAGCHLVGVVAVAGLLWSFPTHRFGAVHGIIARCSGFLIAAVGCFRVGRYLAGIEASHHLEGVGTAGVWSMGLAAGFVPCWDAIALIVLANSIGQLGWGLLLLVAFSLGLAVVLVGVGWLAGRLQHRVGGGDGNGPSPGQRWLGFASGLVLAGIGLGLLAT